MLEIFLWAIHNSYVLVVFLSHRLLNILCQETIALNTLDTLVLLTLVCQYVTKMDNRLVM